MALRVCDSGDVVCDVAAAAPACVLALFDGEVLGPVCAGLIARGITVHLDYPHSKPLLQAADRVAQDVLALHYSGGTITIHGTVGQALSASATVTGGVEPLTAFVGIDGVAPSWLSLGIAGHAVSVSGTPTTAGFWRFNVDVQDSASHEVSIPVVIHATR